MLSRPRLSVQLGVLLAGSLLLRSDAAIAVSGGPPQAVQDCSFAAGTIAVGASMERSPEALTLTLVPADRACLHVTSVRLLTPAGKRLKPKRARARAPGSIGIGIGVGGSGGSGSIFVTGGGASTTAGGQYRFTQRLPADAPGPGWIWLIEAVNGCRQESFSLRVPAERLAGCSAAR